MASRRRPCRGPRRPRDPSGAGPSRTVSQPIRGSDHWSGYRGSLGTPSVVARAVALDVRDGRVGLERGGTFGGVVGGQVDDREPQLGDLADERRAGRGEGVGSVRVARRGPEPHEVRGRRPDVRRRCRVSMAAGSVAGRVASVGAGVGSPAIDGVGEGSGATGDAVGPGTGSTAGVGGRTRLPASAWASGPAWARARWSARTSARASRRASPMGLAAGSGPAARRVPSQPPRSASVPAHARAPPRSSCRARWRREQGREGPGAATGHRVPMARTPGSSSPRR